jgi:hypothetical protein
MLYYPQLSTGAISQFPVKRSLTMRTVANQLPSGLTIRMADQGLQKVQWQLRYAGITDAERTSIEGLFEASEGQLNTFTFLDPTANLLAWSEDWTQAVWTADALLLVNGGVQDPFGNSNGMQLTNTAQATGQVLQNIAAPSSFEYSFSVYVRSNAPTMLQLMATANGQTFLTPIFAGNLWMRAATRVNLSVQQDGISFGIQLPAGAQVDVFGAQVEGQPQAGLYKKTIDLGGVYADTRFSADLLTFTADATDQNSCQLGLISDLN